MFRKECYKSLVATSCDAFAVTLKFASLGYFKGEAQLGYGGHVDSSARAMLTAVYAPC